MTEEKANNLIKILDVVSKNYPNEFTRAYYELDENCKVVFIDGAGGDGLAEFIVCEIISTYDSDDSLETGLVTAYHSLEIAMNELAKVLKAIGIEINKSEPDDDALVKGEFV